MPQYCNFLLLFILICCAAPAYATKLDRIYNHIGPQIAADMEQRGMTLGNPIFMRVFKKEAMVELWVQENGKNTYTIFKQYPICVFSGTLGPKLREGDEQAPEGFYDITADRLHPESKYHLALNIGYPNDFDVSRGRTGNSLMIHGGCQSEGCYAMTDAAMDEIYMISDAALRGGQPKIDLHIFPFIMTKKNMAFHQKSTWGPFWQSLKPAYDIFQATRMPPKILIRHGRYRVRMP